ncbi:hypothetical protein BJ138DRAFT_1107377 [Hygrophoropsis aurantiaca]|uniref:Uncharacterized protein n=1 Tax=Hygrophoropsis aurantiaca TaxID=72124 RepID=A0ACB7ZRU4_9AGAM|nr:hypothetical protein BJ138DRAFT_1107377 [Hygrophoropsis aurantiaca]
MSVSQLTDPITSLLPPELITKIFQLCIPELAQKNPLKVEVYNINCIDSVHHHTTTEGPVLLCRVSRSWKDFVYGCPMLWTNICAHSSSALRNPNVFSSWLARSGNLPLAVCISLGLLYHIDVFTIIFNHAARIRSLKFLNPSRTDMTWDFTSSPFTQLDTFAVETVSAYEDPLPNLMTMITAIIATAPHLRSIKWNIDNVPISLTTIGSQLKELNFSTRVADVRTYNAFRACPNVVKLSVIGRSHTKPTGGGDVLLADLQILHSYCFAMQGVVAPKLRKFAFKGYAHCIPDLLSFIRHSPQLDDLDLNLVYAADYFIQMMPHLSTITRLKITVSTFDPIFLTNEMLKTLTCHRVDGAGSCLLPNLRHLDLRIDFFDSRPFDIDGILLVNMLESRCHCPDAPIAPDGVVLSHLESFTFLGAGIITHEARQRLQSLQLQAPGLSLHINVPV